MRLGLLLVLLVSATACAKRTVSVEGDVYLLMQNGDVKRGASNTVRLLRDTVSLLSARTRVCSTFAEEGRELQERSKVLYAQVDKVIGTDRFEQVFARARAVGDSAKLLRAHSRLSIDSIFLKSAVAEAPTGVNAHYHFAGIEPGHYILWAETTIGDNHYTWWAPVVVTAGDSLKKDLDNSTEADATLSCPPLPYFEKSSGH